MPLFGLEPSQFETLAKRVTLIIHCAAKVNAVLPYVHMRMANVAGSVDVLRLSLQGSQSTATPVHYVSTLSVLTPNILDSPTPDPIIDEAAVLCKDPSLICQLDGYRFAALFLSFPFLSLL